MDVSLPVRLWVEIIRIFSSFGVRMSASLWGCELKYGICLIFQLFFRQPPCEAVSWNIVSALITFFRILSASLWGCELKYHMSYVVTQTESRQPPCEAVSWNMLEYVTEEGTTVSLPVRLWVEICVCRCFFGKWDVSLPVRLWVEMLRINLRLEPLIVSLPVRLWVEIRKWLLRRELCWSASLWGCELKYFLMSGRI